MDFVCDVDAKAWGAANRVTLYPDQRQTWVLATTLDRGEPDDKALRRQARAVMGRWFSDAPLTDLGTRSGAADAITIGAPTLTHPELRSVAQRYSELPGPLPLLRAGRVVYVPVTFEWRSRETSKPWPTRRVSAWGLGGPCPVDADWILTMSGELQSVAPEPTRPDGTPPSVIDELAQEASAALTPSPIVGLGMAAIGAAVIVLALRR